MKILAAWSLALSLVGLGLLSGCGADVGPVDNGALVAVDDSPDQNPISQNGPASSPDGGAPGAPDGGADGAVPSNEVSYPIGTLLETTADLNLRDAPSTAGKVLRVMPNGSQVVTVNVTTSQNGFLNVKHSGLEGWAAAKYLKKVVPPPSNGGGSAAPTDAAVARAKAGVGFSYWWGHGRWLASGPTSSNKGTCSGNCPSCSHGGSYGADCSGYVGKIWQVPASNSDISVDGHPYSTAGFVGSSSLWSTVSRGSLKKADALVYNTNGAGHILLFESGDGWGNLWSYEARGCSYGIVHNLRSCSSSYKGIRRTGY